MPQPTLPTDNGVIITLGIVSGFDRCEVVLPMAAAGAVLSGNDLCKLAVEAFVLSTAPTVICAMFSSDCELTFVHGEGMVDGRTPYRTDFASGTYLGSQSAGVIPSQVAGLIVYYEEAADVVTGERMRVGKNFIPGIPEGEITGDIVSGSMLTAYQNFANLICNGITAGGGAPTFYRGLAAVRTPAGAMRRIGRFGPRGYVATQRRRLVPH